MKTAMIVGEPILNLCLGDTIFYIGQYWTVTALTPQNQYHPENDVQLYCDKYGFYNLPHSIIKYPLYVRRNNKVFN